MFTLYVLGFVHLRVKDFVLSWLCWVNSCKYNRGYKIIVSCNNDKKNVRFLSWNKYSKIIIIHTWTFKQITYDIVKRNRNIKKVLQRDYYLFLIMIHCREMVPELLPMDRSHTTWEETSVSKNVLLCILPYQRKGQKSWVSLISGVLLLPFSEEWLELMF